MLFAFLYFIFCFSFRYLHKELMSTHENEQQSQQQIQKLKVECESLKRRLHATERERDEQMQAACESKEKELNELRLEYKSKLEKFESDRVKCVAELEKELLKQRERTIKMLEEKEAELEKLKESLLMATNFKSRSSPAKRDKRPSIVPDENNVEENTDVGENSERSSLKDFVEPIGDVQPRLIHLSQQNAYKQLELTKLRTNKMELEYKLKQAYDEQAVEANRYQDQIGLLKQEIERLKLNQSRNELNSGSNLEYIKNVVYSFMTTKEPSVKASMSAAIAQILQFNKNERQKAQAAVASLI
jgi:GRIP and coiled-coil domain-containing protein 1